MDAPAPHGKMPGMVAPITQAGEASREPPALTGRFELHVFVEPLNPPEAKVTAFREACAAATPPMKALLLHLDYVDKGFVGVLQTSRYVDGDEAVAREASHHDAEVLRAAGLTVIREKIEAMADDAGIPVTPAEGRAAPADRYFEFHLAIDGKQKPLSEDDMRGLRGLSAEFSARLGTPVPLSYNALKPSQRFLNLRFRGVGLDEAMVTVRALEAAIEALGDLEVKKLISEYICFDTNRALDNGWVEPLA